MTRTITIVNGHCGQGLKKKNNNNYCCVTDCLTENGHFSCVNTTSSFHKKLAEKAGVFLIDNGKYQFTRIPMGVYVTVIEILSKIY